MRKSTWTTAAAGCAIVFTTALLSPPALPAVAAAAPDTRTERSDHPTGPAATAIVALTTTDPAAAAAAVPDDFGDVVGYRPALRDGMLVNPTGTCSSPVPLPGEFDTACQGHDLGYDLLRYADRSGEQLGPWARQSLDRQLDDRLHAACAARPDEVTQASCRVVASVAATAVDTNSWRQGYAAPRPEPVAGYAAVAGVVLLAGVAVARRGRPALRRGVGVRSGEHVRTQGVPA
ncbi:hypothetical protein [Rhodococcus gannanensis]|uniref:Phospholipase A2 n=1 Tax=Rhodococcus gannanensis TaxID=1960308 RepID=A0ABW4NZK1_9NOCA